MAKCYNKGEWSELYAFIKLLKEGKIYAADENANKLEDIFLPIIKIIRKEQDGQQCDYYTGEKIKIYKNNVEIKNVENSQFQHYINVMFPKLFLGSKGLDTSGAFSIPEIEPFMANMGIAKVKASSNEKIDLEMQIHDFHTGYSPEIGFSVKSDIGSAPTLLNPGKNTRVRYKINNLSSDKINEINKIDKTFAKEYMKARIEKLLSFTRDIVFDSILDETFEDNLIMIDSALPQIYGEMVLQHYLNITKGIYDCNKLIDILIDFNPMNYRRTNIYRHKFKKLVCASALGMTPGKVWNGLDTATGGYIIIKRDGDVLCYHLYNRNFFEEYLLNNTRFDRPSSSRYDYGYVFEKDNETFIDLNVQIRFKSAI
jgi:hypothetical protein